MQAAEQARQAFGRGRGGMDGRGIVSVESLMDEIIDRAYDEDDEMGVRLPAEAKQHGRQQCSVIELVLLSAYTQDPVKARSVFSVLSSCMLLSA